MGKIALVVDDSRLARMTLCKMLKKLNYDVREASGVIEGESVLALEPVDLVFMDVMMPELDGFDGLSRLQEREETRRIPVVMYSGDISEASIRKAYAGGATGYLQKPASEQSLLDELAKVDNLLSGFRLGDEVDREATAAGASRQMAERLGASNEAVTGNSTLDYGRLRAMFDEELVHAEQRIQERIVDLEKSNQKHIDDAVQHLHGLQRDAEGKQTAMQKRFVNLKQTVEVESGKNSRTERELRDKLNQALEVIEQQQKGVVICGIIAFVALVVAIVSFILSIH